jgi:phosphoserine phosphatase
VSQTVIVTITGTDRPGITASILHLLDTNGADVLDMEQVIIRDRLNLGLLLELDDAHPSLKDLLYFGWERDLHVDFEVVEPADDDPTPPRFAVTVIGETLPPATLAGVADAIVAGGGNIDRISRLSKYPVISYELLVVGGQMQDLREKLMLASSAHQVDVAVQQEGLARRAKRLVVIDMDSTLIRDEVIDLLADEAGVGDEVRAITTQAMQGSVSFDAALRKRVALLAGLEASRLASVAAQIRLTPGARTFARTLRRLGYKTAIVSGGFDVFADQVKQQLGMDVAHANRLVIRDNRLTGELEGNVIDGAAKARLLSEIALAEGIPLEQTVAIGDGSNDLEMLTLAGLGIAFNARPLVDAAADTTLKVPYLDAILFVLGIRREDIETADRESPFD